jgi:general secretion pathway protein I
MIPCDRVVEPGQQSKDRGFTLLEVMVALAIAATVLVSLYRLQTQSITMERIAHFHSLAPFLAEQVVSDIERQAPDYPLADSGDFGADHPGYAWELETRDVDGLTDPQGRTLLKQIEVNIFLNDEDQFTLRTYRLVDIGS